MGINYNIKVERLSEIIMENYIFEFEQIELNEQTVISTEDTIPVALKISLSGKKNIILKNYLR